MVHSAPIEDTWACPICGDWNSTQDKECYICGYARRMFNVELMHPESTVGKWTDRIREGEEEK